MTELKPCPFCDEKPIALRKEKGKIICTCGAVVDELDWNNRPHSEKFKLALQKLLNAIDFALDENVTRRTANARLKNSREEVKKELFAKSK